MGHKNQKKMNTFFTPQDRQKAESQFGEWYVSKAGDMTYKGHYHIMAYRLTEEDWIAHLSEKNWINWNDFIPAYMQALKNAGIQFVNIRVHY